MLSVVVIALCAALASAARLPVHDLDGRIVGGMATNIEKYPYQLSVLIGGFHFCGGSIISANWVLTAAHCVEFAPTENVAVRAGSSNVNEGGSVHQAELVIVHPDYRGNDYDFALVKVKEPFPLGTPGVQVIELVSAEPEGGETAVLSGWGATADGGDTVNQLRVVEVPVIDRATCKKRLSKYDITDRMICTHNQGGGKDACHGDSGGPMVVNGKQAGVVSWGIGCAERFYPGVYANIANQREWIRKNSGV